MARIIPDGWETLPASGPAQRELETLGVLARGLPDDYAVYHAVHWTNVERVHAIHGEIDFVVVNRAGHLLLIEQKSGVLEETPDGLVKRYGNRDKQVAVQMARTVDGLRGKLLRSLNGPVVPIEHLLYCPDYVVRQPLTAGLLPERIVDARRADQLSRLIQAFLPPGEDDPALAGKVDRFLRDIIRLETDVSTMIGQARTLVTRVAGGLSYWGRRIDAEPFRLRVTGTAGSGKTQLALAEYGDAVRRGERPLYVCYNRPLADHIARIAPAGGMACNFHALCDQLLRQSGRTLDFSQPGAYETLVADAAALPVPDGMRFDTVIVDEGQDFSPAWRDMVLRHARPEARLLWLEDPMQNLYGNPPVELPGWVRLRADGNFRSPRPVARFLQAIVPPEVRIEALSPIGGDEVDILTYTDAAGLLRQVKEGLRLCYAAGFRVGDTALLSYRGREGSALFPYDRLGPNTLRMFTGGYDLFNQPVYSDGDLLLESVYRFKGQSAPAVVLAEIDFESLDDKAIRKLFVGASRATMKLVLVMSERAAARLLDRLP